MVRQAVQQGRSERRAEAYPLGYVEGLNDARTPLAACFNILVESPVARRQAKPAIHEFALIHELERRFSRGVPGLIRGIGDDAAVLEPSPSTWWHLSTDLLAEGIHFDLTYSPLEAVGYRAAMANLSDMAAMGASPRYLLVSIAIPRTLTPSHIYELYSGMMKACRPYNVALIGGDTSSSKAGLFLSMTILGTTLKRRAFFRHGANVGDHIYVSGTLGDSLAGLRLLTDGTSFRSSGKKKPSLSHSHRQFLIRRHLHPTARVAEGQLLNHHRLASAAIDLSDGLSGDLRHICAASRVGAEVEIDKIPTSPACRAYALASGVAPTQLALAGGEDYELLFTAPPQNQQQIERHARARGYRITRIGTIRPARFGIQVIAGGRARPMSITSYQHFG